MRESGRIILADPGGDKPILEAATLQCAHCGKHWIVVPGSGRVRGFCMRCNGPICGPKCAECLPAEKQIENIEAGRPLEFRPVKVGVSGLVLEK